MNSLQALSEMFNHSQHMGKLHNFKFYYMFITVHANSWAVSFQMKCECRDIGVLEVEQNDWGHNEASLKGIHRLYMIEILNEL